MYVDVDKSNYFLRLCNFQYLINLFTILLFMVPTNIMTTYRYSFLLFLASWFCILNCRNWFSSKERLNILILWSYTLKVHICCIFFCFALIKVCRYNQANPELDKGTEKSQAAFCHPNLQSTLQSLFSDHLTAFSRLSACKFSCYLGCGRLFHLH